MKSNFIRTENNPGAIVNIDNESLKAYKALKQKDNEINNLKNEVQEIKDLLRQLLEKSK